MNSKRKKRKSLVLPLLVAAGLLLPVVASAQGGIFQRGGSEGRAAPQMGLMRDGETTIFLSNQLFGNPIQGSELTNQNFGGNFVGCDNITNESFNVPLGSGLLILLATGAGYATIKSRKRNKKN